jgi:hypothetical protein
MLTLLMPHRNLKELGFSVYNLFNEEKIAYIGIYRYDWYFRIYLNCHGRYTIDPVYFTYWKWR